MAEKDIFERDRSGERVSMSDPEFYKIYDVIHDTMAKLQRMNTSVMTQEEVNRVFAEITGTEYDETLTLFPPFYMDFGKNLKVGKNVLIQQCCTFMDRCGITIGDGTFIAPKVNLITIGHPKEPSQRDCTYGAPIVIGRNVWIGIASTVLPGVTIGDNSIVGANSVVTHDVPPNTIVAGSPARKIGDVPLERGGPPEARAGSRVPWCGGMPRRPRHGRSGTSAPSPGRQAGASRRHPVPMQGRSSAAGRLRTRLSCRRCPRSAPLIGYMSTSDLYLSQFVY